MTLAMTEISFHSRVGEPIAYACRLLRKALRHGTKVVVSADEAMLQQLDRQLWIFDALEFIPHWRLPADGVVPPRLRETPVWLVEPGQPPPSRQLLVNLDAEIHPRYEDFERVIEIVATDPEAASAARRRWRQYGERGHAVTHHEAS